MSDHTQPTQEQLQEEVKKSQEALAKLETQEVVDEVEDEGEDTVEEETTEPAETKVDADDKKEEVVEEDKTEEKDEFKEKFVNSSREAQILASKDKKWMEAAEEADSITDVAEEELKAEARQKGFNFDDMSDVERALFKTTVINDRKIAKFSSVAKERKDIDAWNQKVDSYIDDPKTLIAKPELEGKQEEFKVFAGKPTRRGVDFEDLVSSFLYSVDQTKVKHKGKMFETGTGGPTEKPKSDKVSIADAARLRETNYPKYKELLLAGKIANE